jgi:hypothetical protein
MWKRKPARRLIASVLRLAVGLAMSGVLLSQSQNLSWPAFGFYQEFSGANGYTDPQVTRNLNLGMMNGLTFYPPVASGVVLTAKPFGAGLMLHLPAAALPAGIAASAIDQQGAAFSSLPAIPGAARLWDLLPEWDQYGGPWVPQGHPSYRGMTRQAAHSRFLNYYQNSFPELMNYLSAPQSARAYLLASVTDYPANVFDAYDLGVEMQLLERGNDELGDLSTGIAYLRGAARQYGRGWGIDISTWRGSTNAATTYSPSGTLLGGWSDSYIRRECYMAFLSGAMLIQAEATTYSYPNGQLNPFGVAAREFADFALRRHSDLGQPWTPVALLVDPDSGFDTKHGPFNQYDYVWYQNIPYTSGDSMTNQFYRLAYPNHWLHGLAPGAPFADSAGLPDPVQFQKYLAAGNDPRPFEPMPTTRWGGLMDVITTRATSDVLARYPVILMMGGVQLDARLRSDLTNWVAAGGTLVMNAAQAGSEDQSLAGVSFDNTAPKTSTVSKWIAGDTVRTEPAYRYSVVRPDTASVLATSDSGDPLITANPVGSGRVILTTPAYLQPISGDSILGIGVQLLDWLFQQYAPAQVTGPPIAYVVNQVPGKLVVGLFNSTASTWNGTVSGLFLPSAPDRVLEYVSDQPVGDYGTTPDGTVTIAARIPPFDLKVFAIEYSNPGNEQELKRFAIKHATRPLPPK